MCKHIEHVLFPLKCTTNAAEVPNKWLLLTNPGAAHRVLRPRCLLSGFAAEPHVRVM